MFKLLLTSLLLIVVANADTVHFKNGANVTGTIASQDAQTVTINGTTYSMNDVKSIEKGTTTAPPPPATASAPTTTEATSTTEATTNSGPKLVGPTGATGVIRRSHRRVGRRDGASID